MWRAFTVLPLPTAMCHACGIPAAAGKRPPAPSNPSAQAIGPTALHPTRKTAHAAPGEKCVSERKLAVACVSCPVADHACLHLCLLCVPLMQAPNNSVALLTHQQQHHNPSKACPKEPAQADPTSASVCLRGCCVADGQAGL